MRVEELETFLLRPTHVAGAIGVLARTRVTEVDTGVFYSSGRAKAMWWQLQGVGRHAEGQLVQEAARTTAGQYEKLLENIEYLKTQQWAHDGHGAQEQMTMGVSE